MQDNLAGKRAVGISRRHVGAILGSGAAMAVLPLKAATKACDAKVPVSHAVVAGVTAAGVRAYRNIEAGVFSANDCRNLRSAFTILFAHFDEIGATAVLEKSLRSRVDDSSSQEEYFGIIRKAADRYKLTDLEGRVRQMQAKWPIQERRSGSLRKQGMQAVYARAIWECDDVAKKLDRLALHSSGRGGPSAALSTRDGLILPVDDYCEEYLFALQMIQMGILNDPNTLALFCTFYPEVCLAIGLGSVVLYAYVCLWCGVC